MKSKLCDIAGFTLVMVFWLLVVIGPVVILTALAVLIVLDHFEHVLRLMSWCLVPMGLSVGTGLFSKWIAKGVLAGRRARTLLASAMFASLGALLIALGSIPFLLDSSRRRIAGGPEDALLFGVSAIVSIVLAASLFVRRNGSSREQR
jgi:hypothetical protein